MKEYLKGIGGCVRVVNVVCVSPYMCVCVCACVCVLCVHACSEGCEAEASPVG